MPRKPVIPIYRLHKGTGQAAVTINGKHKYLGKHGTPESKQLYDRLIAEWLAGDRGKTPEPSAPKSNALTVNEILAAWATQAPKRYRREDGKPHSELTNFRQACRPLIALYGLLPAIEFGRKQLKAVQLEMARRGWCRRVCNRNTVRIRTIFRWAIDEEMLPASVLHELRLVKALDHGQAHQPEPVKDVDPDTVERTLTKGHPCPQVVAMVRLQLATGMRPGEVVRMRGVDIDRKSLKIDDVPVWIYRPETHKTAHLGHSRAIALGPAAQALLKPWLTRPADDYLFSPAEATRNWLTSHGRSTHRGKTRTPGARYQVSSYDHAIAAACARAKVEPWAPNQLRHSNLTSVDLEHGIEIAAAVGGHRSSEVTKRVYAHGELMKAARVAAKMG